MLRFLTAAFLAAIPATLLTPDRLILFWRHSSTWEHDFGLSWLSSTCGRRRCRNLRWSCSQQRLFWALGASPRRSTITAVATTERPARITVIATMAGATIVVEQCLDITTSDNQKPGTRFDEAVAARGATRFRTVSANCIGDTDTLSCSEAAEQTHPLDPSNRRPG